MQTRFFVFFFGLILAGASASAQVGPVASDEPFRWNDESRSIAVPVDQSVSTVSLDDALVAKTRLIGTPRAESSAKILKDMKGRKGREPDSISIGRTSLVKVESGDDASGAVMSDGGMFQTVLALGGVLLLIFGLAQLYKRLAKSQGGLAGAMGAGGNAPSGLVEILGRYPVSSKMTLVVMRFDRRILLLAHAGSGRGRHSQMGAMTVLCELDRPEDVASVLLKVRNEEGDSIAQSFARTLREADEMHDQYLDEPGCEYEASRVRVPSRSRQPSRVMTNEAGDRAEFGVATESEAAAGVLRRRLAAMRPANFQGQQHDGIVQ